MQETWVQSLLRELILHMLCGKGKKMKNFKQNKMMIPDTAHICSKGTLDSPQQSLGVAPCSWHQSIWPASFLLWLLFSHSVMSNSLQPHGQQYTRLPCPSLSPRVCSISCPLSQWHHPTISSSVTLFSSCPQSFPASGSFPACQFFTSGGQTIRALASGLVLMLISFRKVDFL